MRYITKLYHYTSADFEDAVTDMTTDINRWYKKGMRVHSFMDMGSCFLVLYEPNLE